MKKKKPPAEFSSKGLRIYRHNENWVAEFQQERVRLTRPEASEGLLGSSMLLDWVGSARIRPDAVVEWFGRQST